MATNDAPAKAAAAANTDETTPLVAPSSEAGHTSTAPTKSGATPLGNKWNHEIYQCCSAGALHFMCCLFGCGYCNYCLAMKLMDQSRNQCFECLGAFCFCCCYQRKQMREEYGINGSLLNDCLCGTCCYGCTGIQMLAEAQHRNKTEEKDTSGATDTRGETHHVHHGPKGARGRGRGRGRGGRGRGGRGRGRGGAAGPAVGAGYTPETREPEVQQPVRRGGRGGGRGRGRGRGRGSGTKIVVNIN